MSPTLLFAFCQVFQQCPSLYAQASIAVRDVGRGQSRCFTVTRLDYSLRSCACISVPLPVLPSKPCRLCLSKARTRRSRRRAAGHRSLPPATPSTSSAASTCYLGSSERSTCWELIAPWTPLPIPPFATSALFATALRPPLFHLLGAAGSSRHTPAFPTAAAALSRGRHRTNPLSLLEYPGVDKRYICKLSLNRTAFNKQLVWFLSLRFCFHCRGATESVLSEVLSVNLAVCLCGFTEEPGGEDSFRFVS